jgi:hypothetical protein
MEKLTYNDYRGVVFQQTTSDPHQTPKLKKVGSGQPQKELCGSQDEVTIIPQINQQE